jgi:hypothetical protein
MALKNAPARLQNDKLALFVGRAGAAQRGELMVIGRALNGGDVQFKISELSNAACLKPLIASAYAHANPDRDPLGWVADCWGASTGYNTRRSAFWRVVRSVTLRVVPATKDDNWHSSVIWTNLYKVSPAGTGNPTTTLMDLQREACFDILATEISDWQPARVLFLTGLSWAWPFLKHLQWQVSACRNSTPIEAVGHTPYGAQFVVAPHPERKPEEPLVLGICKHMKGTS